MKAIHATPKEVQKVFADNGWTPRAVEAAQKDKIGRLSKFFGLRK